MEDHAYKVIDVVGTSPKSSDDAIRCGVERAGASLRWFEVVQLRGNIESNAVSHWQATVRIGFRLDDHSETLT